MAFEWHGVVYFSMSFGGIRALIGCFAFSLFHRLCSVVLFLSLLFDVGLRVWGVDCIYLLLKILGMVELRTTPIVSIHLRSPARTSLACGEMT
jgi:hypothetical protein